MLQRLSSFASGFGLSVPWGLPVVSVTPVVFVAAVLLGAAGCQPTSEPKVVDQSELEAFVAENPELKDIEMTP